MPGWSRTPEDQEQQLTQKYVHCLNGYGDISGKFNAKLVAVLKSEHACTFLLRIL